MKVITIGNQKGGVAKTTTTVNLAAALAQMGKQVLVVDLDPQGQCATMLAVQPEPGAFYLLTANERMPATVQMVANWLRPVRPGLTLLPGDSETASAQIMMNSGAQPKPISHIAGVIRSLVRMVGEIDYVLLDTSPSLGGLQERALWAADLVIVPVQTEFAALDSLVKMTRTLVDLRRNQDWRGALLGVLPTFYDDTTRESKGALGELKEKYGQRVKVLEPVHRATVLRECWSAGKHIFELAPESRAAKEYAALAKAVVKF